MAATGPPRSPTSIAPMGRSYGGLGDLPMAARRPGSHRPMGRTEGPTCIGDTVNCDAIVIPRRATSITSRPALDSVHHFFWVPLHLPRHADLQTLPYFARHGCWLGY